MNRSSMRRRSRSMRIASAGSASSMYSGSTQRGVNDRSDNGHGGGAPARTRASPDPSVLPDEIKQQHARDHRAQSEKAHLPVAHFGQPPKRLAPQTRNEKRQDA